MHRAGVPLTFRAGGTSLSGQALSGQRSGRHPQRFQASRCSRRRRVRVQPGVTVGRSMRGWPRTAPARPRPGERERLHGRRRDRQQLLRDAVRYRSNTYRTLESMVLVLPSGTVMDSSGGCLPTARGRRTGAARGPAPAAGGSGQPRSVATIRRLFSIKNTMGYGVNALLDHDEPARDPGPPDDRQRGHARFRRVGGVRTVECCRTRPPGCWSSRTCSPRSEAVAAARPTRRRHRRAVGRRLAAVARSIRRPRCPSRRLDLARRAACGAAGGVPGGRPPKSWTSAAARSSPPRGLGRLPFGADDRPRTATGGRLCGTPQGPLQHGGRCPAVRHQRPARGCRRAGRAARGTQPRPDRAVRRPRLRGHGHLRPRPRRQRALHAQRAVRRPASMRRYEAFTKDMVDLVLGLVRHAEGRARHRPDHGGLRRAPVRRRA